MKKTAKIQQMLEKLDSQQMPEMVAVEFSDESIDRTDEEEFRILTEYLGWDERRARARIESLRGNVVSDVQAVSSPTSFSLKSLSNSD